MGRKMQNKHSDSYWESHHPDCGSSLFHIIKHHPLRHFVKRFAQRRDGGERNTAGTVPAGRYDAFSAYKMKGGHNLAGTRDSYVEEKVTMSSSVTKNTVRSQIKALIVKGIPKKRSRHRRSSTCPPMSQSFHTTSTNDPFSETVVTGESTRTKRCVECGATPSGDFWEYNLVRKHQPMKKDLYVQEIKAGKQCIVDDKLTHGRKHTSSPSPHVFKPFVKALDTINMNKDLLLTFLQDPVSPLAYQFNKQQAPSTVTTLTRSVSFPLPYSSSKRQGSLPKGKGRLCISNKTQKLVKFESSKDCLESSMSSVAKWGVHGNFDINEAMVVRNIHSSSGSAQGQNQKEIKYLKNRKQKIEHVTGESRKEKLCVTMDAVIDKLPQGHGISHDFKKEILKKLTDPITVEGEHGSASCNGRHFFTHSFTKHRQHGLRRISSLQEPLESYCQLYENSFNTEVRYHQSEQLRLTTKEADSSLRMLKPVKRVLSLPDLHSFYYSYQNGKFSDGLSLTAPTMTSGDGTMGSESIAYQQKRLDLNVHSKCQLQLDTPVETSNKENLVIVGENDLDMSNIEGSGSDTRNEINGKEGIIIDDFRRSISENGGNSSDNDIEPIYEYKTEVAASDSKSKPGPTDRLDNVVEQQEANLDSLKVTETTDNAQKVEILSNQLNYEIPHFHVDTRDKAEYNYVRYVLEISGLTGNESISAWHSSEQPLDPLLYEEMEGDPDFCSNESGNCNHHVLFDLINEALLEIYGRSCCYYPIPLSSLSHIRPMPNGSHTLREVWTHMSQSLSLKPNADQTADFLVSRDLAKHDGWMNLQLSSEFVALELEDLIFHDLLEEIMWTI